jgi:shikimate kinase
MIKKKHIYLTGFMGAGKSKIGPLLAQRLGIPFYDCDDMIADNEGMAIKDIFEQRGESSFRDLETKMVMTLGKNDRSALIALGGGALNKTINLDFIGKTGLTVYLKSSPEAIFDRVKHSKKRPLLNVPPGPEREKLILTRIRELLKIREPVYEQADIVFQRDSLTLEEIIDQLWIRIHSIWKKVNEKS